eukprot:435817-Rhodomonas_salina.4
MTFDGSTILHDQALSPSQVLFCYEPVMLRPYADIGCSVQARRRSAVRRPLCDVSNNSPSPIVRKSLGKQLQDPPVQEPTTQAPVEEFVAPTFAPVRKLDEAGDKVDWAFWGSIAVAVVVFALISSSSFSS